MTATTSKTIPFWVHSTFRNFVGKRVKPHGLEWGLDGESHLTYVPALKVMPNLSTPETRRGLVEAYNRWAFSKELEFKTTQDIQDVTADKDHVLVEWKPEQRRTCDAEAQKDMKQMLQDDPTATGKGEPVEVWINGVYEGNL